MKQSCASVSLWDPGLRDFCFSLLMLFANKGLVVKSTPQLNWDRNQGQLSWEESAG